MRIVTDSAADLPQEIIESSGIITVPIRVNVAGKDRAEGLPSTSQPSPWDFSKVFAELTARGEPVLCLTLSKSLSGTFHSAAIAARHTGGTIRVIDTRLVSAAQGLLCLRLAAAARSEEFNRLCHRAEQEIKGIRAYAALANVEPIVRGGRTSIFARHAADRDGIKLIFTLNPTGGVQILERVRGRKSSLDRLAELLAEQSCAQAAIVHVDCPQEAATVAASIEQRCGAKILYIQQAGGAVRAYAGRGAVIVAG